MTDSTQAATSLLTEHFQYTPLSLIDDIINSVNTIIYRAVTAVETGLLTQPPASLGFAADKSSTALSIPDADGDGNVEYPEARHEIENGVHQLETLLEATVDKDFDKFEIFALRSILSVPEELRGWIRLSHYENLSFNNSPDSPTPESINLQRRRVQETQKLQTALRRESARNEAMIAQLRSLVSSEPANRIGSDNKGEEPTTAKTITNPPTFAFLTDNPSAKALGVGSSSHAPLTTNVNFALSQMPALRSLLADLRPKLHTLPAAARKVDWDSAREERKLYIETRTRRHLERTRGLELDEQGRVRDGEWAGVGRRVQAEEVAAMEGVVQMLGRDADEMDDKMDDKMEE